MKTLELKHPVEHNGATYHRLTMRRVRAGDLAAQERVEGDMSKVLVMIERLANLPSEVVNDIDVEDFNTISLAVAELMGKSSDAAGQTPSS